MTGVVAVHRRRGQPSTDRLDSLLSTLDYRGHDGRDRWVGDGVAIGHQHHWTTPQSIGQSQPVVVDGAVVALAGRLDARDRLAPALPPDADLAATPDARLLGHAYRKWGPDCLERTIGAFGAVVWDPERRRLVAARDPTGIRHLFVAAAGDLVVVGSDAATVRAHPAGADVPAEPSLAAYLADDETTDDAAFYEGVRRLPSGTRLVADAGGTRTERYWHPADAEGDRRLRRRLRPGGAGRDDPVDRVRAAVRAAVADRLRCRDRPGVLMSGGLDSTAIAGVAAADLDATPPAFSMVFEAVDDERLAREERARIRDVAEAHGLDRSEVVVDDAGPLSDPAAFDDPLAESPCLDPTQPAVDRLLARAGEGHRVVLTGHGGNVFDGSRFAYADLLRRGHLATLLRQARRDPVPTRRVLKWYALAPAAPWLAARVVDLGPDRPPPWLGPRLRACDTGGRSAPERFRSVYRRRDYAALTALRREHKLHTAHRRAVRHGLSMRMPLLDARVVAAAYAAPTHRLCAAGEQKRLFRDAFADVLPASVLAVQQGMHFEEPVAGGLARRASHLRSTFEAPRLEALGYVADGAASEQLDAFIDGDADWLVPWRLYATERWLASLDD